MKNWLHRMLIGAVLAQPLAAQENPAPPPAEAPKVHPLKQIFLADSPEEARKLSFQPDGNFVVATGSLKHLEGDDLTKRLIAGKDRNIDKPLLEAIGQVLTVYLQQHGYLIVDINIPDQSIVDGAVRFVVVPGKFRQIKVIGNHWFSESQLRGDLHVDRGEIVRIPDLDQAIAWTNDSNPFRRVQAHVERVPNSNEADLIIGVQERSPLRLVANFDDAGNDILGRDHYTAAATYANLWGLDHQATYQYITTNQARYFQGHVFVYRAPLPWRHYLQFSASYLRARPVLFGGIFNQDAENMSGDLRYTIPLRGGENSAECFANLNFKESNNNLEFGGASVQNSKTDVFQLTLGASKVRHDKRGAWVFGANVTFSPGDINSRNTNEAFDNARAGTKASYAYGSFSFQRLLTLDRGWELQSRGNLQIANHNLLSSEQLTVGGSSTVRGFNENVFAGDEGFVFSNDLLLPVFHRPLPFLDKKRPPLDARFLVFYDAAHVRNKVAYAADPTLTPLASTGVGLRASWVNNFSLSFDYGWQITHLPTVATEHGRGHVKVSLAY